MTREEIKDEILRLWYEVDQPANKINEFLTWLQDSDFFKAPSSTQYHLAREGGLAEHSLNVYNLFWEKVARYQVPATTSTIIICGLGHDLCKVDFYKVDEAPVTGPQDNRLRRDLPNSLYQYARERGLTKKWAGEIIDWIEKGRPGKGMPEKKVNYTVKDSFPMGHGEKSVSILQDFFTLTDEEKLAIRWHMTAFDAGIHFNYPSGFPFRAAAEKYPLVTLLFTADYEASQILEREVPNV